MGMGKAWQQGKELRMGMGMGKAWQQGMALVGRMGMGLAWPARIQHEWVWCVSCCLSDGACFVPSAYLATHQW